jgi:hypothetical protein
VTSGATEVAHTIASKNKGVVIQFSSPLKVDAANPMLVQA